MDILCVLSFVFHCGTFNHSSITKFSDLESPLSFSTRFVSRGIPFPVTYRLCAINLAFFSVPAQNRCLMTSKGNQMILKVTQRRRGARWGILGSEISRLIIEKHLSRFVILLDARLSRSVPLSRALSALFPQSAASRSALTSDYVSDRERCYQRALVSF